MARASAGREKSSSLRDTTAARRRLPWVGVLPAAALSIAGGLAVLVLVQGPERRERVEGLAVLAEDWADLVGKSEAADTTRRELWLFLQRLYDKKAAGSSDVQ